jgi:hypothetical protein
MDERIDDELLNECRKYAMDRTGYDIELKVKPFDSQLDFPENLEVNDDDLTALIDKYETGLNSYLETFKTEINDCHASISKITKLVLKDTIVMMKIVPVGSIVILETFGLNQKQHLSIKVS